ncbi:MAG: hypothetical protein NWE89_14740 [Candidatus Bathyarchaeota archaeon]|nr:hypothetical protein [Candidatus Bathyarchaeota archaeon]
MTEQLRAQIKDTLALLENYRSFGPMVAEGIDAFRKIDECLAEPSPESIVEIKVLLQGLNEGIGPYRGLVPSVAHCLDELNKWVAKQ